MPRYTYRCQNCEAVFQVVHSIKEKLKDCEECRLDNTLQRVPSMPLIIDKEEGNQKQQVGSLVKEYIEGAKEDLKDEMGKLSNQVYKDD